ncbi:ABC transporter [Asaia sp. SF2.1]|nr:ABC transporter [Asaia sp. SF2.1]
METILQDESTECGLACIAMISQYHGYNVTLPELRMAYPASQKGMTARDIMHVADAMGLQCHPLKADLDEIKDIELPCVLHWDLAHFVVLSRIKNQRYYIHDPASGTKVLFISQVGRHYTGVAFRMARSPTFRRRVSPPPISLRKLAGSINGLGRNITVILVLSVTLEILYISAPLLIQTMIDEVIPDADRQLSYLVIGAYLLTVLLGASLSGSRGWLTAYVGAQFSYGWAGNVARHLTRLPLPFFQARHLGDIVSRVGSIDAIQKTIVAKFPALLMDLIVSITTAAILFYYNLWVGLTSTASVVLYFCIRILYYGVFREANLGQISASAKQNTQLLEILRGIQSIKVSNKESQIGVRYINKLYITLEKGLKSQYLGASFASAQLFVDGARKALVLVIGTNLCIDGNITIGMLTATISFSDQLLSTSSRLADSFIELKMLRVQTERLADIMLKPIEAHQKNKYVGPLHDLQLSFRNVYFRYTEREKWLLENMSFDIAPGEHVAIIGPSGCGKSTVARLMLGLADPERGTISVGGKDIRDLGKTKLRQLVAAVLQEDQLFSGSIAENISFFDESFRIEAVQVAAVQACIDDEICAMPMGYQTLVGDMGAALSAGQKQRLLLARALYRNPRIIVLDEATSNLDLALERRLCESIGDMKLTRITFAHRPETISAADRVIELRPKLGASAGEPPLKALAV